MAVEHDGHLIEVKVDRLWGGQVVYYDSEKVVRKRSPDDTTIDLVAMENGWNAAYGVRTSSGLLGEESYIREVRRNGEPVYELWRQLAD